MDPSAPWQEVEWVVPERFTRMMQLHQLPTTGTVRIATQYHSAKEISFFVSYAGEVVLKAEHVQMRSDMCLGFDLPGLVNLGDLFRPEGGVSVPLIGGKT